MTFEAMSWAMNIARESEIPAEAKLILIFAADSEGTGSGEPFTPYPISSAAERTGVSETTARWYVDGLVRAGYARWLNERRFCITHHDFVQGTEPRDATQEDR